jgi:hypothetical protein
MRTDLPSLSLLAREWGDREAVRVPGKRGQPPQEAFEPLLGWVGLTLARVGAHLSRGAKGSWARVAEIVYEAANVTAPKYMERELSEAHRFLQAHIPTTLRNNSQQRMRRTPE